MSMENFIHGIYSSQGLTCDDDISIMIDNFFYSDSVNNRNNFFGENAKNFYDQKTDETVLYDLDARSIRQVSSDNLNFCEKPKSENPLFDEDDGELDIDGWMRKPTIQWETTDTINWLIWAGEELGHSYGWMSAELAMTGEKLLSLSQKDFLIYDRHFGGQFYDLLHGKYGPKTCDPSSCSLKSVSEDERSFIEEENDVSEEESEDDSDVDDDLGPEDEKRPRIWKFIRNLLFDPKYCPAWIRWENYEDRTFRFIKNRRVAKRWGKLNKNKTMTYQKFTRAIRYYYTNDGEGIFASFPERLVYRFGGKATGLETDNPNFEL